MLQWEYMGSFIRGPNAVLCCIIDSSRYSTFSVPMTDPRGERILVTRYVVAYQTCCPRFITHTNRAYASPRYVDVGSAFEGYQGETYHCYGPRNHQAQGHYLKVATRPESLHWMVQGASTTSRVFPRIQRIFCSVNEPSWKHPPKDRPVDASKKWTFRNAARSIGIFCSHGDTELALKQQKKEEDVEVDEDHKIRRRQE